MKPDGKVLRIFDRASGDDAARVFFAGGKPVVTSADPRTAKALLSIRVPVPFAKADAWLKLLGHLATKNQTEDYQLLDGGSIGSGPFYGPGAPNVAKSVPIAKTDAHRRIAIGVVLEPTTPESPDLQGDWYSPEDIELAAHGFMESVMKGEGWGDVMHDEVSRAGVPVESYIAPADFVLGDQLVKAGSWVVAMHYPDDAVWKRIVDGEFNAFSIGGFGIREG